MLHANTRMNMYVYSCLFTMHANNFLRGVVFLLHKNKQVFGGKKLYGTVNYFTELLKTTIMNNFVVDQASPIQVSYTRIKNEITTFAGSQKVKKCYLINFEKAFNNVRIELIGQKEE